MRLLRIASLTAAIAAATVAVTGPVASAGSPPQAAKAEVLAYHAGSLNAAIGQDIGPAFTKASGYPFRDVGGPSVELANKIAAGEIITDVYMSADLEVIPEVLVGARNGDRARWYLVMCRQQMVLAYSPQSPFKAELDAAARGATPWYEVVQRPGFRLKRGDPRNDPGGYRGVFAFRLAELHYRLPGLADRIMGGDDNEVQIEPGVAGLTAGTADASVTYRTAAIEANLPFVELPREVDQSDPALAWWYAQVGYTTPRGQSFHGTPLVYGVTIPTNAPNPDGAAAFVAYLLADAGKAALERRGFPRADTLLGGDAAALPPSLLPLVRGSYGK